MLFFDPSGAHWPSGRYYTRGKGRPVGHYDRERDVDGGGGGFRRKPF